jgi:hypothetical protein
MRLLILFLCLITGKVWADPKNAAIITNLQSLVGPALINKSVQDIGFGLYLDGATLSFNGQTVVQGSSTNPQSDLVNYHIKNFCSTNLTAEATGLSCQASYGNDSSVMELGDIKSASLLAPMVYDQYMDIAAQQLIRILVQPAPVSKWSMMLANSSNPITNNDNNQRALYANALAQQALYDVARYSLNNSYGTRLATESFNKYSTPVSSSSVSTLSMMQSESTKWYNTVDFTSSAYSTDTSFLQAMAQMQSFQLWMSFQQYQQLERVETLLAAILANGINSSASGTQTPKR